MVLSNEKPESLLNLLSSNPSHINIVILCYSPQCPRLQQARFLTVLLSYQQYFS